MKNPFYFEIKENKPPDDSIQSDKVPAPPTGPSQNTKVNKKIANNKPKQKWEYAHINYYWGDSWSVTLIYLHPDGPKITSLRKEGMFSKKPNLSAQVNQWITQLGQDGYEMIGFSPATGVGNLSTEMEDFWFKRPVETT